MNDFDKSFSRMRGILLAAIIAKLAIVGGIIWVVIYAIDAFAN